MRTIFLGPVFHKLLISAFIFFMSNSFLIGQTTIRGRVVDEYNESLGGANILVQGTTEGAFCDENGFFELTTSALFPFVIEASYVGFLKESIRIKDGVSEPVIRLNVSPGNEVIVSVSRKQEMVQVTPASTNILRERQLRSDAVAEPMLSLRNLPGVDIAQYSVSGGQINLRGKSEVFQTETFIIADYRNIVIPSLGFLVFGQHPIDMIDLERIEVVKGPGGALYGPGVESGIVHFISKDPFRYEGTTLSLGGGNRNQFVSSFRHAKVINDKFAYKITGQYRSAKDFELDSNDPSHAARIDGWIKPIVSAITGEPIDAKVPDYNQKTYGFTGTLAYKPSDSTTVYAVGGYGVYEGIFRNSQGEGYVASGRPFAQIRLNSGGLFAQTFWSKNNTKDGNAYFYSTGSTSINISNQWESQLQYNFDVFNDALNLTVGGDFRMVTQDTKGTINGRFEDEDNYTILGLYTQGTYHINKKFDAIVAGRLDRFSILDKTTIAPRLGLIYKPTTSSSFRFTWNKAFGVPTSLNLFADTSIADAGAFQIYLLNGKEELTFNDENGYNFITQSTTPKGDLPLATLYGLVTSGLASSGSFPQGLTDYLFSITPNFNSNTAAIPTSTPITRSPLALSQSDMFEIGYKGLAYNKFSIIADIYYSRRKNVLSAPLPVTPFLIYPTAGSDLADSVISNTDPDILASYGFTQEAIASIYASSIEEFTLDENGAPTTLGILSSDNSPADFGTYDFAWLNFDSLEYWGIDFGLEYFFSNDLSFFGNISWLSKSYWEELTLNNSDLTAPFSLNVPDKRYKFGVNFYPDKGIFYNSAIRISSDWESVNGANFSGPVDGYTVLDVGVGYKFRNLQLSVTATNLFDQKYRPIFGAPDIRRLVLAKAVYEFK
jgi:outer membrane receptor for ferrienterochelin and colicins